MNRTAIRDLAMALRRVGEHGDALAAITPGPEQLQRIREDLEHARQLLAAAAGPAPTTRCPEHPTGPVEPDTDGECLLCRIRRGRVAAAAEVAHQEVTAAQVLEVIDELGTDTAIRQFGGRAVSAAIASTTRTPTTSTGT
ncbi:hypothetical protein AB0L66_10715 [Streptomyces sp. NPDC052207]|uniref:hypothetical protein n=1 Tax=Streptomyces sp. NPDC052207 TaxID=3155418 RepID=UPI003419397C